MNKVSKLLISILVFTLSVLPNAVASAQFSDVNDGYTYAKAINFLQENGIISGYADGSFKPNSSINRVEFLKIVLEASDVQLDATQSTGFSDVEESSWYGPYLKKAKQENWVSGYTDNTFHPGQTINKVEALKIIAEVQDWQLAELASITTKPYRDIPDNAWYLPYVDFAKTHNVLKSSVTQLDPGKLLTRGEVSDLLYQSIIEGVSNFQAGTSNNTDTPSTPQTNSEVKTFKQVTFTSLATNSFQDISLNETLPNVFYKDEIYTLKGKVTKNGYHEVLLFLSYEENGETQYINYMASLNKDNSFTLPVHFSKYGNFQIGIIPGTSGSSKVYSVSVLPTTPEATSTNETATEAQNVKISTKDNKTNVSWTKEANQIYKINIWQNQKLVSYLSRQDATSISVDFKDFSNFQTGKTNFNVETAKITSIAPLKISSPWVSGTTQEFSAIQHQSGFLYTNDITVYSFKDTYSAPQKITITGTFVTPSNNEAAIIKPNGLVERVTLSSDSVTSKYYSYTILPAKSSFSFQYTPKTSGTYIIEFNKQNGAASFNTPIYIGTGVALLPDYFEISNAPLTTAPIDLKSAQQEMLNYINNSRKKLGFSSLKLDSDLNNLSQLHSEDMATNNYFSHINLKGESPSDRRKALNINTEVSENLGKAPSIRYGHEGLMRSAVHRENILDPSWTKVGLGFAKDKYGYVYITEEFSHEPYSEADLANFQTELLNRINAKRADLGLESIVKNETLDKISQALTQDLVNGENVTSSVLSNYFKENNISNKAALVVNGNSPNNEKIITETTKGIDNNHSQWLEAGIDYALDQFGSIIFVILYTN